MKKLFVYHAWMRIISILAVVLVFAGRLLMAGRADLTEEFIIKSLFLAFAVGCIVLAMYPDCSQNIGFSLIYSSLSALGVLVAELFGVGLSFAILALVIYEVLMTFGKGSKMSISFRQDSLWSMFENYASMFYNFIFIVICLYYEQSGPLLRIYIALTMGVLLFIIRYAIAYTGWTFIASRKRECRIRTSIAGFLRGTPDCTLGDGNKLSDVYQRALVHMSDDKPYLNPACDILTFAEEIFSNKTYLSRAVFTYFGQNFKQFLNYYRVQYAIGLMRENPDISIADIAFKSGFNSSVSFNMAFKTFVNDTPGNYRKEKITTSRLSKSGEARTQL